MEEFQSTYDLRSVDLPRMSGLALRIFTELLESPLRALLIGPVLDSAGIHEVRGRHFNEAPAYYPLVPVAEPIADENRCIPQDLWPMPVADSPPGFHFRSLGDYALAYRDGRLSPVEVARRLLSAIEESDGGDRPLRAFIALRPEEVMRQAEEAGERLRNGRAKSILDGVPIAVKDEVDMVPYPTTAGTSFLGRQPAEIDSTAVSRLRATGALLIGKANMHEIGIGVTGQNPHHGTTRNPYNPSHHTGGSSSGPATAVAAGFCPVALGADGGGSVRVPAALCGLVGLKATFGRISEAGAYPLGWSVAHVGPISADVYGATLAYAVVAGPCSRDHHTWHQPRPHLDGWGNTDLSDLALGIYEPWFADADPATIKACQSMVHVLENAGATIKSIVVPDLAAGRIAHLITIAGEMAQEMDQFYREHRRDFGLDVRINLALARQFTTMDYVQAQRVRARLMQLTAEVFQDVDAILTPTSGVVAPAVNEKAQPQGESDLTTLAALMRFVFLANLIGAPAISFPAGYSPEGLPVGLMAMGRWWEEHHLLRLARVAELHLERQKPERHFDLLAV